MAGPYFVAGMSQPAPCPPKKPTVIAREAWGIVPDDRVGGEYAKRLPHFRRCSVASSFRSNFLLLETARLPKEDTQSGHGPRLVALVIAQAGPMMSEKSCRMAFRFLRKLWKAVDTWTDRRERLLFDERKSGTLKGS